MGDAARRGEIGDMMAASTKRPPAESTMPAAWRFAAGDEEFRSKKYASRFRCGATERAASPICAAVTALITRSAPSTARLASDGRQTFDAAPLRGWAHWPNRKT